MLLLTAGGGCIASTAGAGPALLWTGQAAAVLAYVLIRLRHLLPLNTRLPALGLHPALGAANWITLIRAGLTAGLAGFIYQPSLAAAGLPGRLDWAPGAVYFTAVVLDFTDGLVARATKGESRLGEMLDGDCDAAGLLIASALAVSQRLAPAAYLWVGAGVYILRAAVWTRKKSGRPAAPIGPRPSARLVAGCEMVFAGLILLPVFDPQITWLAVWVMIAALTLSLGKDWIVVCGDAAADGNPTVEWVKTVERFVSETLPLVLRAGIAATAALRAAAAWRQTGGIFPDAIGIVILVFAALCVMGVAARASAVLLSFSAALPAAVLCQGESAVLSACAVALVITGAGRMRLWQPEDRIFLGKLGESRFRSGGTSAKHPRHG